MFTIKTVINKVVALQEVKTPVIALPESDTWDQVMAMLVDCNNREHDHLRALPPEETLGRACYAKATDWKDLGGYDFLELHPQLFADAEGKEELYPEEIIESRRPKVWLNQAIAILVLDAYHPERGAAGDIEGLRGAFYQFVYPGDAVYIMNSAGATIHTVR